MNTEKPLIKMMDTEGSGLWCWFGFLLHTSFT